MKKHEKDKLEPVFNGLLRKGINPDLIIKNKLFLGCLKEYLDGESDVLSVLGSAEKINIISGNIFSGQGQLKT